MAFDDDGADLQEFGGVLAKNRLTKRAVDNRVCAAKMALFKLVDHPVLLVGSPRLSLTRAVGRLAFNDNLDR